MLKSESIKRVVLSISFNTSPTIFECCCSDNKLQTMTQVFANKASTGRGMLDSPVLINISIEIIILSLPQYLEHHFHSHQGHQMAYRYNHFFYKILVHLVMTRRANYDSLGF
ncbi:hypothetical protein Loa_00262 [Legionella oakridgensis ATCC 33761 = DSM 21215]|uniref:Uncharacterized protein n=2 Tax=Legionella oakridgensis TaxID=29423 RepID=W0BAZ4_9GAMM|nr:hypothetical protein Loa_00262 [Legionella oakridgensis ATCC 33761 = DSM 21215]KTD37301.1 hypothetical protein Loak_2437 [Legionella oakridgensis]STY15787.1 Uncharacterised protein [Legionella longbeachae]